MIQMDCSKSVALTPVDDYFDRFMKRSKLRNWGFNSDEAEKLEKELNGQDHEGPFMPLSVNICLGDNLQHNWSEAIEWLRAGVEDLGHYLVSTFEPNRLSFFSGENNQCHRSLKVVRLDLGSFWSPQIGLCSLGLIPNCSVWPTIEVVWFLAMNPQVAINMDGVKIPYMHALGLSVGETGVPCVYHSEDIIYIIADSQNSQSIRKYSSFVAYAD